MKPHEDILGHAIMDYWKTKKALNLKVHNNYGVPEKMRVKAFFKIYNELPEIEQYALSLCKGAILDIGAGAGRHSLALQEMKKKVTALEISPLSTEVIRQRGVGEVIEADIFTFKGRKYDTLLMLMNGIGLVGNLERLKILMIHIKELLLPAGQWLFDSSDISYLYESGEKPRDRYFGEISYQFEYKNLKGPWFQWLYVDKETLENLAFETGWRCQIIFENAQDEFLARLTLD